MPHRASIIRRSLAVVMAAALLVAQAIGLWHGVSHAPAIGHAAPAGVAQSERGQFPAALFGHDEDASKCRLFDALTGGGAVDSSRQCAPAGASHPQPSLPEHGVIAAATAGYRARAPPVLS